MENKQRRKGTRPEWGHFKMTATPALHGYSEGNDWDLQGSPERLGKFNKKGRNKRS